jgi:putative ABC transport system permease protein
MPVTRFERWARGLFGVVLHLYPAHYRDEYGREMTLVFVDRLRGETKHASRLFAALGAIASVGADAPGQHLQVLAQDVRLAFRLVRREKWFATVAIGTIAIGIGAATPVFSVGKSMLVDALPYPDADRATMVWVSNPRQGFDRDFTSYPRLVGWRTHARLIETFTGYTFREEVMTGTGDSEQLRVVRATPEFFHVVRAEPVAGRLFATTEEQSAVVVLSHGLWQRKFGGQSSAVGQTLRLDSTAYTIIGVLPRWFRFPERNVDAWVPLQPTPEDRRSTAFWLRTVARLERGVSLAQAQQEMNAIAATLGAERVEDRDLGVTLVGLRDEISGSHRAPLLMLTAAVVGVLLIACVNVAGMLTARGAARRHEVAIRTALGASRRRVGRQMLTEAVVLFLTGGLLGMGLGALILQLLRRVAPPTLAFLGDASFFDVPMLAIALGTAALTGALFGVLPSWKTAGADVVEVVASGVKGTAVGSVSQRFRRVLVVSQIAIAAVVVSSATLMINSLIQVQRVDLGFRTGGVLTARLQLPRSRYPQPADRQQFFDRLLERARGMPGVTGVASGSSVLLGRLPQSSAFTIEGRPETIQQPLTFDVISPDFFRVLRIPLLRGRYFSDGDRADSPRVAIINETAARTHWPNDDPLGKRFTFGDLDDDSPWLTVVGVVADTRRAGIDRPVFTESYQPYTQDPRSMNVLVRADGEPAQLVSALRTAVRELDPDLALAQVAPLDALIDDQIAPRRFNTWLLSAFGAGAIALTAIGLYSLLAYLVALRRHEIAVRLSIGAAPRDVLGLIVREVSGVVGIGVSLGLVGALTAATALQGLLFGITPWDPMSQAVTLLVLGFVGIASAWIPLRRAMRVDPAIVLRTE